MTAKKSILLIIDNHLARAPRAQTMIRALKGEYEMTVAALSPDSEKGYSFEELKSFNEKRVNFHFGYPLLIRKPISFALRAWDMLTKLFPGYYFEKKIWNNTAKVRLQQFKDRKFDAIICHHATNLPVCAKLSDIMNAKLFFNAHEYYPREFDNDEAWVADMQKKVEYICKTYLVNVKKAFCATPGYVIEYNKNFGLDCILIPCVKPYYELPIKVPGDKILLVHQGYANPDRKIEKMIEMCGLLDERFEFHFYLIPTDLQYFDNLKRQIENKRNAKLFAPIKPEEVMPVLNSYDIGIYILEPTNFNTTYMLPNKMFEFVQARLMIAISPSTDMIPFVTDNKVGIIADDHTPKAMARILNELKVSDILTYKNNAALAAHGTAAESYYPIIKTEIAKHLA